VLAARACANVVAVFGACIADGLELAPRGVFCLVRRPRRRPTWRGARWCARTFSPPACPRGDAWGLPGFRRPAFPSCPRSAGSWLAPQYVCVRITDRVCRHETERYRSDSFMYE